MQLTFVIALMSVFRNAAKSKTTLSYPARPTALFNYCVQEHKYYITLCDNVNFVSACIIDIHLQPLDCPLTCVTI